MYTKQFHCTVPAFPLNGELVIAAALDCVCLQIVSSSYTAAAYLTSIGFGGSLQPGKHVLLLGSQGTADELAAAGLQVLDAEQLQLPVLDSVDTMLQMQVSLRPCDRLVAEVWCKQQ
jgi:ribonucleotide monophosphatase NagD (HAD superfamily)